MVQLEEARKVASKMRLALLNGMKPSGATTIFTFAILALDKELTRIEEAIEEHDDSCPWFKQCCIDAIRPSCPAAPVFAAKANGKPE